MKPNIVIFGETGAGKSSAINLLQGTKSAKVSDEALGQTLQSTAYTTSDYTFYDTAGLSEGSKGRVKAIDAIRNLIRLLRCFSNNGVSLLIFVIKKGKITETMEKNYKLFVETICMKKVPVLLLMTHCEDEKVIGNWWNGNKHEFDKYGMKFRATISGCFMNPEDAPAYLAAELPTIRKRALYNLQNEIAANKLNWGWSIEYGWSQWLSTVAPAGINEGVPFFIFPLLLFPSLKTALVNMSRCMSARSQIYEGFKASGLSDSDARELTNEISRIINIPECLSHIKIQS